MSKFKVGDKVKCLVREFGNETVGKIYTVKEAISAAGLGWFRVEKDDNGLVNSYQEKNFELVPQPQLNITPLFKKGDRVIYIGNREDIPGLYHGNEYIIDAGSIQVSSIIIKDDADGTRYTVPVQHLQLNLQPTEGTKECPHTWKEYFGLNERFHYCTICDKKKETT